MTPILTLFLICGGIISSSVSPSTNHYYNSESSYSNDLHGEEQNDHDDIEGLPYEIADAKHDAVSQHYIEEKGDTEFPYEVADIQHGHGPDSSAYQPHEAENDFASERNEIDWNKLPRFSPEEIDQAQIARFRNQMENEEAEYGQSVYNQYTQTANTYTQATDQEDHKQQSMESTVAEPTSLEEHESQNMDVTYQNAQMKDYSETETGLPQIHVPAHEHVNDVGMHHKANSRQRLVNDDLTPNEASHRNDNIFKHENRYKLAPQDNDDAEHQEPGKSATDLGVKTWSTTRDTNQVNSSKRKHVVNFHDGSWNQHQTDNSNRKHGTANEAHSTHMKGTATRELAANKNTNPSSNERKWSPSKPTQIWFNDQISRLHLPYETDAEKKQTLRIIGPLFIEDILMASIHGAGHQVENLPTDGEDTYSKLFGPNAIAPHLMQEWLTKYLHHLHLPNSTPQEQQEAVVEIGARILENSLLGVRESWISNTDTVNHNTPFNRGTMIKEAHTKNKSALVDDAFRQQKPKNRHEYTTARSSLDSSKTHTNPSQHGSQPSGESSFAWENNNEPIMANLRTHKYTPANKKTASQSHHDLHPSHLRKQHQDHTHEVEAVDDQQKWMDNRKPEISRNKEDYPDVRINMQKKDKPPLLHRQNSRTRHYKNGPADTQSRMHSYQNEMGQEHVAESSDIDSLRRERLQTNDNSGIHNSYNNYNTDTAYHQHRPIPHVQQTEPKFENLDQSNQDNYQHSWMNRYSQAPEHHDHENDRQHTYKEKELRSTLNREEYEEDKVQLDEDGADDSQTLLDKDHQPRNYNTDFSSGNEVNNNEMPISGYLHNPNGEQKLQAMQDISMQGINNNLDEREDIGHNAVDTLQQRYNSEKSKYNVIDHHHQVYDNEEQRHVYAMPMKKAHRKRHPMEKYLELQQKYQRKLKKASPNQQGHIIDAKLGDTDTTADTSIHGTEKHTTTQAGESKAKDRRRFENLDDDEEFLIDERGNDDYDNDDDYDDADDDDALDGVVREAGAMEDNSKLPDGVVVYIPDSDEQAAMLDNEADAENDTDIAQTNKQPKGGIDISADKDDIADALENPIETKHLTHCYQTSVEFDVSSYVTNSDVPEVTWYKDGNPIHFTDGRFALTGPDSSRQNYRLQISGLRKGDCGAYTGVLQQAGIMKGYRFQLKVPDTTMHVREPNPKYVDEHEDVTVRIEADHPGKYEWLFGNNTIIREGDDDDHYHFPDPHEYNIENGSVLLIKDFSDARAGEYEIRQERDGCFGSVKIKIASHHKMPYEETLQLLHTMGRQNLNMSKRRSMHVFFVLSILMTALMSCCSLIVLQDLMSKLRRYLKRRSYRTDKYDAMERFDLNYEARRNKKDAPWWRRLYRKKRKSKEHMGNLYKELYSTTASDNEIPSDGSNHSDVDIFNRKKQKKGNVSFELSNTSIGTNQSPALENREQEVIENRTTSKHVPGNETIIPPTMSSSYTQTPAIPQIPPPGSSANQFNILNRPSLSAKLIQTLLSPQLSRQAALLSQQNANSKDNIQNPQTHLKDYEASKGTDSNSSNEVTPRNSNERQQTS